MGYKVIESFIDSQTGEGYNEGSVFASDDIERVTFLINEGYLKGDAPKVEQTPDGDDAPKVEQTPEPKGKKPPKAGA